jgi:outer membrane protein assembly factor BamD
MDFIYNSPARNLLYSLVATSVLWGCGSIEKKNIEQPSIESEITIYQDAMELLDQGKYTKAIKKFDEIERIYPYAVEAKEAKLYTAYSLYKTEDYDGAISKIEEFIKLHPGHRRVDYAYYLRALSYYDRIVDVGRDQEVTVQASRALKELVARFPKSNYSQDAVIKLDLVKDHLAGKEMEVGRYYLKGNKLIAAINRFKIVVEKYQTTNHTPEALYRLSYSYLRKGIKDEAVRYAAVLGHNFPDNQWYKRSYELLQGSEVKKVQEDNWLDSLAPDFSKKLFNKNTN